MHSLTEENDMIVNTISTANQFIEQFKDCGRGNQFSYDGFVALFDYLDMLSDDQPIELDVIGICCEFSEYHIDVLRDYYDMLEGLNDQEVVDKLEYYTVVIPVDKSTYIIADF